MKVTTKSVRHCQIQQRSKKYDRKRKTEHKPQKQKFKNKHKEEEENNIPPTCNKKIAR